MKLPLSPGSLVLPKRVSYYLWCGLRAFLFIQLSLPAVTFAQNKIWDKTIGGNLTDDLTVVQPTSDGGYILGGSSFSGKSGDKTQANKGRNDYWVVKLKADGTKDWDKTIGGSSADNLTAIQQTSDGGFILGGYSNSGKTGDKTQANKGQTDYWVVKLNADGSKVWDKTIGGSGADNLTAIQQTKDGGYLLGGSSASGISGDKSEVNKGGKNDYWVVKLNAAGTKVWDKTIGGDNRDELIALQPTSDGNYILGGTSFSGRSGDKTEPRTEERCDGNYCPGDYWLVKITANGTIIWDRTIELMGPDFLQSLQETSDKGFILGGSNRGKYVAVKLKADGSVVWEKLFGADYLAYLRSVIQTSDGGYLLGGSTSSPIAGDKTEDSKGGDDYWLIKIDADGTKVWDKTIGGSDGDLLTAMQLTRDGNFILGGSSYSNRSSDKSEDNKGPVNEETGHPTPDYWVVKLDNSGKNLGQFITFAPISDVTRTLGDAPFALSAKASSGLPVSFEVVSGPATIKNNIITLTGVGTVTVKATQAGNATYLPAPEVTQTFLVEAVSLIKKQWEKAFNGTDLSPRQFGRTTLTSLQRTSDGGYIVGGYSSTGISSDKSEANRDTIADRYGSFTTDYWVIKLDASGNKVWDKTIGGSEDDQLTSLQQTSDGGYILGGTSESGISGDKSEANKDSKGADQNGDFTTDYWVVKLDASGNKEWDKTLGGSGYDNLAALQQTSDGGYILGGTSFSNSSGDKTEASRDSKDAYYKGDYWVVKLTAAGSKAWDKTIGGDARDELATIQQTSDNGYLLGGSSLSGLVGGEKSEANKGAKNDNGRFENDYWIVKLNANGSKAWDKTIGGDKGDRLAALQLTSDGGYILGGSSQSAISGDKSKGSYGSCDEFDCTTDYWIVKLDANRRKVWDKTIGGGYYDNLSSLQLAPDGGYILGGSSYSGISGNKTQANRGNRDQGDLITSDYWVVKLTATGTIVWDRTIGGNESDDLAAMELTPDGGYLLGGTSYSGISGDKTKAKKGYWLVKIQDEIIPQAIAWDMRYGGAGTDYFTDAIKTADGGYLAGGYTTSGRNGDKTQDSRGQKDYWIVKSDKNGKKLWDKRYGGGVDDYLNRVIQTQDGGYLLAGSSRSGGDGDNTESNRGTTDYWVVKVDAQGNKQWDKNFGGSGYNDLKKVIQLSTGEYVLGGSSNSPTSGDKSQGSQGGNDYWLVKISSTGVKLWDKRYGGSQDEILGSFTQTRDGGFLLGGSSWSGRNGDKSQASRGGSDYWAVKTDQDGNLVWNKTYGGSGQDEVFSVGRSHGDYLFISGTSDSGKDGDKSQNSQGGKDYWMLKLDSNGNKLWDKSFGGSQDDELRASTYTDEGNYVLAGKSYSGSSGDKIQPSQGGSDYWVVQVDAEGQKVADQRFGGSGTEELRTVFQTNDGGLLLGGRSNSGVSGDRSQPSQGGTDYWLVKVAPLTNSTIAAREATRVEEPVMKAEPLNLTAAPNPFAEQVTVSFTLPRTQPVQVKIYDSQGQEITTLFRGEAQANQLYQLKWRAKQQTNGLYLLQLQTPIQRHQQKLLLTR